MKVIDTLDRKRLSEGRNHGLAFAFLKKKKTGDFEAVQPHSPCKDYLNDVVYAEQYNVPIRACGLSYSPQGGVLGKKTSYLGMKVLGFQNGTTYPQIDIDKNDLKTNYKNVEALLNWLEDSVSVPRTKILPAEDDYFVAEMPSYWSDHVALTSLYGLLIRMGQKYDGKTDPRVYLNEYKPPLPDYHLWNLSKPKVALILRGAPITRDYDEKTGSGIHGRGIANYSKFDL